MLNIHGDDGGYAPIAPGPLDLSRGRGRRSVVFRSQSEPKRVEHPNVALVTAVPSAAASATTSATTSPSHSPKTLYVL